MLSIALPPSVRLPSLLMFLLLQTYTTVDLDDANSKHYRIMSDSQQVYFRPHSLSPSPSPPVCVYAYVCLFVFVQRKSLDLYMPLDLYVSYFLNH